MDVCIYLRKSRKGDDPGETSAETLRRHREQLLSLADSRGLTVKDIKEEVVSGGSIDARPRMKELLEEVEEERYGAVLVMDIDRLGRGSMADQGIIGKVFRESNTLVITPDKTYDLSDDMDEDYYDLCAFFARKELKQIKKRLQRGKMKSFYEGNYVWSSPPYGYVKSGRNAIVPCPETAGTVREIFRRYIEGESMGKIAEFLNESQIPTAKGCLWSHKSVSAILHNSEYAGDVVWGRTKMIRGRAVKQPEDSWITLPGRHEALITREDFERARRRLVTSSSAGVKPDVPLKNSLAGILRCGNCQSLMSRKSAGRKRRGDSGCDDGQTGSVRPRLRCSGFCGVTRPVSLEEAERRLIYMIASCLAPRLDSSMLGSVYISPELLSRVILASSPSDRNLLLKHLVAQGSFFSESEKPAPGATGSEEISSEENRRKASSFEKNAEKRSFTLSLTLTC